MVIINQHGTRDAVDAHQAAGEALCGPCKASAARRARIAASKRHRRVQDDEDGYVSLHEVNADTVHEAMRTGDRYLNPDA